MLTATLLLAIAMLATGILRSRDASWGSGADRGAGLAWAAALFAAGPLLAVYFGVRGGDLIPLLLGPLLFAAFQVTPRPSLTETITLLRRILRLYVWGSLAAAVLAPEWAFPTTVEVRSTRDLFGFGLPQLAGLTTNPNLLGQLAALSLVLESAALARRRSWPVHAAAATACVLLSQSRTSLVASALGLLLLRSAWNRTPMRATLTTLGVLGAGCLALLLPGLQSTLVKLDKVDLNGRNTAWAFAINEFRAHPLFGYGPRLFSPEYRREVLGERYNWIGQAHGQLPQTLGEAGMVGGIGLATLAIAVTVAAVRTARVTAGLSLALCTVLLVACLSECPLRQVTPASFGAIMPFTVWCLLLTALPVRTEKLGRTALRPLSRDATALPGSLPQRPPDCPARTRDRTAGSERGEETRLPPVSTPVASLGTSA
ncbi:O-antigen ligase family protein [Streptomyces violascens]|uniref:O-antigen ligase family protein n=1 Tax=Streptomyces violascens TaxID=67381 RepID=UPI0036B47532